MKEIAFKYFEDLATEAELNQLLAWLRKKENRIVFNSYRLDWEKSLESGRFPGGGEESWNRLQAQLWQRSCKRWQRSRKIQQFFRVAAIFFFVVSIGSLAWYFSHRPQTIPETFTSVITENGQISKVELPDGSEVWLNAGSKISCSNFFAAQNREITLTGEAFFDVVKNETHPLIVNCGQLKVKVLGTQFNVNAYSPETTVEVILEEGAVELINFKTKVSLYQMKPGEHVKVNMQTSQYSAKMVNTSRYTSWKEGIINFYNLPIEDLVKRLEKRYNQQFELAPEVKGLTYTFTIENDPLEKIIRLMEQITPVKAIQNEKTIKIEIDKKKLRAVGR